MDDRDDFEPSGYTRNQTYTRFGFTKTGIIRLVCRVGIIILISFAVSFLTSVSIHQEKRDQTQQNVASNAQNNYQALIAPKGEGANKCPKGSICGKGSKGPKGDQGERGEKGSKGDKGFASCKQGWIPFSESCYLFVYSPWLTWKDAKNACIQKGGWLVKIDDILENWFVKQMLNEKKTPVHAWMGLHDTSREGHFTWIVDGSPATFTDWNGENPDNWSNQEDCVHFAKQANFKWNDINCSEYMAYVCERQPT